MLSAGGELARGFEDADVCVLNTCTVTREADKDALLLLRRISRRNPKARVVVAGCLATRARDEVLAACPGAVVVPNGEKDGLAVLLKAAADGEPGKRPALDGGPWPAADRPGAGAERGSSPRNAEGRSRATIKIQDGCRHGCSYCIVPSVRPTLSSKPAAAVERELRGLLEEGFREIVLCGIRLGSYRDGDLDFRGLLGRLLEVPGDFRLRLSSLEITDVDEPFLDLLGRAGERLCPSFHLPLQSGSDAVLRRMRRWYTAGEYLRRLERLRERLPDGGFFSDILVGFPGETEADLRETVRVVESAGLSGLHVFRFSARAGTDAASMPGQLGEGELFARAELLRALDRRLREAFARASVGSLRRVIVEGRGGEPPPSPGKENVRPTRASAPGPTGMTDHFLRVGLDRDPGPGLHRVRIVRAEGAWAEAAVEPGPVKT